MPDFFADNTTRQMYHPDLAVWIGFNEAVFLSQLDFILTKNDKVGKFADGQKWYRDKPHDFVVKYFPFWDEGIVKRVIDNLRADGLILARSDLNEKAKDRSLWYTVNYQAVERLSGPVDRLTQKAAKRKEARQARKPKVQNVPIDESTKCTFEVTEVQNVPETKVQIVPTPKDSLSKTPVTPNGVGVKPPKEQKVNDTDKTTPLWQLMNEFTKQTGIPMAVNASRKKDWWTAIREIYELANRDVDVGKRLIRDAIEEARQNNWTVTRPGSLVNTAGRLMAKPTTLKVTAL